MLRTNCKFNGMLHTNLIFTIYVVSFKYMFRDFDMIIKGSIDVYQLIATIAYTPAPPVLSLVPAYEVCVHEWLDQGRGPLKTFHLHRNSTRASTCCRAHGGKWNLRGRIGKEPSVLRVAGQPPYPPHTQANRGGGGESLCNRRTV